MPLADTFTGTLGGIHPVFGLSGLPFITDSFAEAKILFDVSRVWYEEVLAENNQMLLWASPWTSAGIWAKQPVTSISALKELKIRTYDPLGTATLKSAGATPVQLSWADVVPQLSTGGINSVLTSAEAGLAGKFPQMLNHYMPINYGTPLNMVTINLDTWNDLSDELKKAVRSAADQVMERQWQEVISRQARNFDRAENEKVTVVKNIDSAFRTQLSEAGEQAIEGWLESAGPRGVQILQAYREQTGR